MLCVIAGFIVTLCTIPLLIRIAYRFNIVDRPDGRKIHGRPIPIFGGLAIYMGFILANILCSGVLSIDSSIMYGTVSIMLLGTLDDIWDIKALYKLLVQVICGGFVALSGVSLDFGLGVFDKIVSILWIVGITNAINLMDGLDGLAGGIVTIATLIFGIIGYKMGNDELLLLSLSVFGATLAFLIYNFHPAKIFMGDGGSLFLGFILSIISIMAVNGSKSSMPLTVPIMTLAIPIYETGSTIVRRIAKSRSVMGADREHMHYRLLNRGFSHRNVVLLIYILSTAAGLMGVIMSLGYLYNLGIAIITLLIVCGCVSGLIRSKWEGLPISIIEAMFAGKAMVASDVGGIPELIIHGDTGYLMKGFHIEEAACYIQGLLGDVKFRQSMGEKAFEVATTLFKKEEMVRAYERLYMER